MMKPVIPGAWIRRFRSAHSTARRNLVCFPHAGGASTFYFGFSQALGDQADVVAVQYPGRQDRRFEQPLPSIEQLADEALLALRPELDPTTVLFGHSMGAIVAFEVARRMERDLGYGPGRADSVGAAGAIGVPPRRRAPARRRGHSRRAAAAERHRRQPAGR